MKLKAISPMLTVSNISRSVAFYRDVLGFTVVHGMTNEQGAPCWVYLNNGSVDVMLAEAAPDSTETSRPTGLGFFMNVDDAVDVDAFYAHVQASGAPISTEITDEPWGDRLFAVKDPDGYECQVGKSVNEPDLGGVPIFEGEAANALFLQPAT